MTVGAETGVTRPRPRTTMGTPEAGERQEQGGLWREPGPADTGTLCTDPTQSHNLLFAPSSPDLLPSQHTPPSYPTPLKLLQVERPLEMGKVKVESQKAQSQTLALGDGGWRR